MNNKRYYDRKMSMIVKDGSDSVLKRFEVHNYKNFKDTLVFDFSNVGGYKFNEECTIAHRFVGKSIIYGRNATGKTNLGNAILDIRKVVIGSFRYPPKIKFLNADSEETYASFRYDFLLGESEIGFYYTKDANGELRSEQLLLNHHCIYELDYEGRQFNHLALDDMAREIGTVVIERYEALLSNEGVEDEDDGVQLPFIRFLLNNAAILPDSPIVKMEQFVAGMTGLGVTAQLRGISQQMRESRVFDELCQKKNVEEFEEFLNAMGVSCHLTSRQLPDGHYELYFAHNTPIPFFETASSGTLSLMNLYIKFLLPNRNMSFIYMDEFDAYYHYAMAENLVQYFKKKYPHAQVILTTHNTNLMSNRLMRPDCLFILSEEGKLTALCDATGRELREGHNLEKLYIGGEFNDYE